ncbi:MAG: hypothetical protein ACM65M_17910 [Microcoleus sp.]
MSNYIINLAEARSFLNRAEKGRSLFPISDYKITGCVRFDKKWQNLP